MTAGQQYVGLLRFHFIDGREQLIGVKNGDAITVGRGLSNDVVLDDPVISRAHAVFHGTSQGIVVVDQSSLNGTFISGERISGETRLKIRDTVELGSTKVSVASHSSDSLRELEKMSSSRAITVDMEPLEMAVLVASVSGLGTLPKDVKQTELERLLRELNLRIKKIAGEFGATLHDTEENELVLLWAGEDIASKTERAVHTALRIQEDSTRFLNEGRWAAAAAGRVYTSILINAGQAMAVVSHCNLHKPEGDGPLLGGPINSAVEIKRSSFLLKSITSPAIMLTEEAARHVRRKHVLQSLGKVMLPEYMRSVEIFLLEREHLRR